MEEKTERKGIYVRCLSNFYGRTTEGQREGETIVLYEFYLLERAARYSSRLLGLPELKTEIYENIRARNSL